MRYYLGCGGGNDNRFFSQLQVRVNPLPIKVGSWRLRSQEARVGSRQVYNVRPGRRHEGLVHGVSGAHCDPDESLSISSMVKYSFKNYNY